MPSSIVKGICEGLSPDETARIATFMEKVVRAFEVSDPLAIQALEHPGSDPRGQKNSFDFNKSLMEGGDKVVAWIARPYVEPKWEIMKECRHHPVPAIWIDVTLNDGRGDYPYCFACSPDLEGSLRACYYVDR